MMFRYRNPSCGEAKKQFIRDMPIGTFFTSRGADGEEDSGLYLKVSEEHFFSVALHYLHRVEDWCKVPYTVLEPTGMFGFRAVQD